MALHLTPIEAFSPTVSSTPTTRRAPQAAARAGAAQVRRPESGSQQSFSLPTSASSASQATAAAPDGSAVLKALFPDMGGTKATAASTAVATAPTAESAFGANPWLDNPTGTAPDGSTYGYNQQYFATPQTAAEVAKMLGGTVVAVNEMTSAPGSTFQQQQPNEMVQLKNGALINPGLVAAFYTHGYPQSLVDQMISNEVANT
jgi:hypothetical protein